MGLNTSLFRSSLLFLIPSLASAAPMLRLSNTVIGPVSVAQGAGGTAQEVEAYNVGDGTLNLSVASTAAWAAPSVASPQPCKTREGTCIPLQVALQTQNLGAGIHTATVTVSDPNAVDAPQNITVSVQVGGGVPSQVNLYVPPDGSSDEALFSTNSPIVSDITTQSGGNWLSLALDGLGSFRFVLPYKVKAKHLSGMAEGTYNGSIVTSGSGFGPDNKTIAVSLQVTSQPIAVVSPATLRMRIAQGAAEQTTYLSVANRGQGTLSIGGGSAATGTGGAWLTAQRLAGNDLIEVKANPGSLPVGIYDGTVTVATNAVNGQITVPVTIEIVAPGAPVSFFKGVVDNATFNPEDPVAQGGIAVVYGEQLSFGDLATASSLPLEQSLGGASVYVNDQPAPLYYTLPGQIAFQVPYDAQPGPALVRVDRDGQRGNSVSLQIAASAPRLLKIGGTYAIAVNNSDGSLAIPASQGGRPSHSGEAIVIYALGLGQTSPQAVTGAAAPADPLAEIPSSLKQVVFGASGIFAGIPANAFYVGLTPNFVGLYQINVVVPDGITPGDVPIHLELDSGRSDTAFIAIQ